MRKLISAAALAAAIPYMGIAHAQSVSSSLNLIVYPSEGQAPEQQNKDEGDCQSWARQRTGIDPANPLAAAPAQRQAGGPPGSGGAAAGGGAVRGAVGGALIGNIADEDASDYALAGAVVGAARGARHRNQQQAQAKQQADMQTQAEAQERLGLFKNAFTACMEGRKYTVK